MRNRFPGSCCVCREAVPPGAGYFERVSGASRRRYPRTYAGSGQWALRCAKCVDRGHPADDHAEEVRWDPRQS